MSEAKIAELRFKPAPRSPWAKLRVGMTLEEALTALGNRADDRSYLYHRARQGLLVLDPPLPHRGIFASDISDVDVEQPRSQAKVRPCLSCRAPFESEGPGNRMCALCRTRDVSPYAL